MSVVHSGEQTSLQPTRPRESDDTSWIHPLLQWRVLDALGFQILYSDSTILPVRDIYQRLCHGKRWTLGDRRDLQISSSSVHSTVHCSQTPPWRLVPPLLLRTASWENDDPLPEPAPGDRQPPGDRPASVCRIISYWRWLAAAAIRRVSPVKPRPQSILLVDAYDEYSDKTNYLKAIGNRTMM